MCGVEIACHVAVAVVIAVDDATVAGNACLHMGMHPV